MSDLPPISAEAIEGLRAASPDDGDEFLRELIGMFLDDTPKQIAAIKSTLATGDSTTLTRSAHSLKGSAGNFGAEQLAAVSRDIEMAGRENNFTAIRALLPTLDAEYARVQTALEALLAPPA